MGIWICTTCGYYTSTCRRSATKHLAGLCKGHKTSKGRLNLKRFWAGKCPKTGQWLHPDPETQPYKLQVGQAVQIAGLRKSPELNKLQGIIQAFDPLLGRWLVGIGATSAEEGGAQLWVREPNLTLLPGGCKAATSCTVDII